MRLTQMVPENAWILPATFYAAPEVSSPTPTEIVLVIPIAARALQSAVVFATMQILFAATLLLTQKTLNLFANKLEKIAPMEKFLIQMSVVPNVARVLATASIAPNAMSPTPILAK